MNHFPRPQLARALADNLEGKVVFGDGSNGLFLTSPRRTGKSTFLQNDLRPELQSRTITVVYVDLWENSKANPADLITEAIAKELTHQVGIFSRAKKRTHIESISIGNWLKLDTSKVSQKVSMSLADALKGLRELANQPVALIIDEAQQALISSEAESAMFALKSARDQMNRPGQIDLMLVMSGSDRDKLLRLVHTASAPFYGSTVQRMPELGADFIDHVSGLITDQRPDLRPVDNATLQESFRLLNFRPQLFSRLLGEVLNPLNATPTRFEHLLQNLCEQRRIADEQQMMSDYIALKPLERALLWRLLQQGSRFRPYDADALAFYQGQLGKAVSTTQVQMALESLRTQTPSMLWKSARGEYSVADTHMAQWYAERSASGTWPPTPGATVDAKSKSSARRSATQKSSPTPH